MKQNQMKYFSSVLSVVLSGMISVAYAANPASKQYVDEKAAYLQQQINHLGPAAPYSIGSLYPNATNPDGVVIYLDGYGHGIAAAMSDQISPPSGVTYDSSVVGSRSSYYGAPGEYFGTFGGAYSNLSSLLPTYGNSYAIVNNKSMDSIHYCTGAMNCAAFVANAYTGNPPNNDPAGTWYLPAGNELMLIKNLDKMIQLGNIQPPTGYTPLTTNTNNCASSECEYWSSTESVDPRLTYYAWFLDSTTGFVNITGKDSSLGVRAVRAFSY